MSHFRIYRASPAPGLATDEMLLSKESLPRSAPPPPVRSEAVHGGVMYEQGHNLLPGARGVSHIEMSGWLKRLSPPLLSGPGWPGAGSGLRFPSHLALSGGCCCCCCCCCWFAWKTLAFFPLRVCVKYMMIYAAVNTLLLWGPGLSRAVMADNNNVIPNTHSS